MSRIVPNIELQGQAGAVGSNNEWKPSQVIVTGSRRGVLTNSQTTTVATAAGISALTTLGFYGTSPVAQTASAAAMHSSLLSTVVAPSSSFGATQLAMVSALQAAVQEVQNVLFAIGIYATH